MQKMHLTKIQDPKIQHQMDPETYSRMFIATFSFFFFFFAVRGPLTAVASPVAEHRLRTRRLSGHG